MLDILRGHGERYYSSFRPGNPQITWLLADLQSPENRNAKFTMVFFHAPVFSPDGTENRVLREMLHPLFRKYGVDIVFNGTHSYTRAELDGIQYVISGGGGAEIKPVKTGRRPGDQGNGVPPPPPARQRQLSHGQGRGGGYQRHRLQHLYLLGSGRARRRGTSRRSSPATTRRLMRKRSGPTGGVSLLPAKLQLLPYTARARHTKGGQGDGRQAQGLLLSTR